MSPLAECTLFQGLEASWCRHLERGGSIEEVPDGHRIFAQGDPPDSVYAIIGGDGVRLGATDPHGKILMVEVFGVHDVFGEIGVVDGGPRTAEANAQGRTRLFRIPAQAFLEVLDQAPMLGATLCRLLARRLRRTFQLFQDAAFETLEVRFARQVAYLSAVHGRRNAQGIRLAGRYRQPDLADLLGTTPRSIITILNSWRASGLVSYDAQRGWLTVLDEARLKALVGTGTS